MRIAIDTNAYVSFCRGEGGSVAIFREAEELAVPFIVLGELRAGFAAGTKARNNERELAHFLASKRVRTLWPDEDSIQYYANLFAQLSSAGMPIPTNDIWIASLVIQHNLSLFTFDEHFNRIPQLLRT